MTQPRTAQTVVLPGQSPGGQYILSVLLKRTYNIVAGAPAQRAPVDVRLRSGDKHFGDPMITPVEFESDFVPFKRATDVVLNGRVYAPGGRPTETCTASLSVGDVRKDLVVFGDRVCRFDGPRPPIFGEPASFTAMDLRYERAYGGVDIYSTPHMPCPYVRNPIGRGFLVRNIERAVEDLPLPNLENPDDLLTPDRIVTGHFMHWERQPLPWGFGWTSKTWQPRGALAGVMPCDRLIEQELRRAFATAVPEHQRALYEQTELPDMDFGFFNGASDGLVLPYLRGDEPIATENLSPDGALDFDLPGDRPVLGLDIGMGVYEPPVVLQTVMIRMEPRQVDLVWRAAVAYPGPDWLPQMTKMEVFVA